jgi:predicted amidohydrolase
VRRTARHVRVCAAQYGQRRISSFEYFADQIEYFAQSAATCDSHLLLFPEFVTAQLYSTFTRGIALLDAMEQLAALAPRIDALFREVPMRHRLHVVGGTTPVRTDKGMRNVAHLYTPSGGSYTQEKLHITPAEREYRSITPGDRVKVFETALGRPAIVVCYDIKFPELVRMLVENGADIILNPFATDERKSCPRVLRAGAGAGGGEHGLRGNVRQRRRAVAQPVDVDQLRSGGHLHSKRFRLPDERHRRRRHRQHANRGDRRPRRWRSRHPAPVGLGVPVA